MSPVRDTSVSAYDRLYLEPAQVEERLARGERRRELDAMLGEAEAAALAPLAARAARTGKDPSHLVVLIPGLMGSQLGARRGGGEPPDLLWVDPVDIQRGRLGELALGARAIEPLGPVLYSYLRLKLQLSCAGLTVRWYDYDWRRSITAVGAELAQYLRALQAPRITLVGHSLGGLVARAALADPHSRVERVVTLGTPHGGSYAALQALRGSYVTVRRLAQLDPQHDAETLAETVFATYPSLYQMLPAGQGLPDLADASLWPRRGPRLLDALRAAIGALALPAVDSRLLAIAGCGIDTVTSVRIQEEGFSYGVEPAGDGTVPHASAAPAGCEAWFAPVLHAEFARDSAVAGAVIDLLMHARSTRLLRRPPVIAAGSRQIPERTYAQAFNEKLDWSAMSPSARLAYLGSLNAPVAAGRLLERAP